MKKILPAIVMAMAVYGQSSAQNTFPTPSGNVGIGTTSPNFPLDIVNSPTTGVGMQLDGTAYGGHKWHFGDGITTNTTFSIKDATAGVERFAITSSGNVGIGTTAPTQFLSVNGNVLLQNSSSTPKGYLFSSPASNWGPQFSGLYFAPRDGVDATTDFSIGLWDATSGTPDWASLATRFFINGSSGNTGIGTTSPVSMFQVDDGCTKASIGDASGTALNYGTSYLGFNASRSGTSWLTNVDGNNNNGGGVIYSSIFGDMYFSIIPTNSSSTGQTLADANVKSNIAMRIDHTDGAVYVKQVYVQTSGWPDFVFKKDYALRPLSEVKTYIDLNEHLPDMPAAATVEKDGLNLGEMNKALLKKVEELTLYLIEKDKEINAQKEINKQQQETNQSLEQKFNKLASQLDMLTKKQDK